MFIYSFAAGKKYVTIIMFIDLITFMLIVDKESRTQQQNNAPLSA